MSAHLKDSQERRHGRKLQGALLGGGERRDGGRPRYIGMGVNVDWQNPGYFDHTALSVAPGHVAVAEPAGGQRASGPLNSTGQTALSWAATDGHAAIVELLLAANAPWTSRATTGDPAALRSMQASLMWCVHCSRPA